MNRTMVHSDHVAKGTDGRHECDASAWFVRYDPGHKEMQAVLSMTSIPLVGLDGNMLDGFEFCSRVYALFESVRDAPEGPSRLWHAAYLPR
jgi:hypothetical protein